MVAFFFFLCDRCLEKEVGIVEVGCGSWLDPVFGSGVWVMAEVGCWSLETTNVWVLQGHGEIGVGHGDGFGGDQHESLHG